MFDRVFRGLLGVVLIGVAVWMFPSFAQDSLHSYASTSWPSTEGVIVASRVKGKTATGYTNAYEFWVDVTYRYTVDGKPHTSSRVSYVKPSMSNKKAEALQQGVYHPGASVKVYYCPQDPAIAVLEHTQKLWPLVVLGLLLVGGCFLLFLALRK